MLRFLEYLGEKGIGVYNIFFEALYFTYQCLVKLIRKNSYNSATNDILNKQIYFTAVQLLPLILFIGVVFGAIIIYSIVDYALDYGLKDHIGSLVVAVVINEFAPLTAVFLVALRSGAAISTEIAVMKVSHELNTLRAFHIDIIEYLFLPRIIAGIISICMLSALLGITMLIAGYLSLLLFLEPGLDLYTQSLVHAITVHDFILLFSKSLLFGFFVTLIPIYSGLNASLAYTGIPIAVLNGMVALILAIVSIEVITLLIQFV